MSAGQGSRHRSPFERVIEALAGGLGNSIGWLAEHGVLLEGLEAFLGDFAEHAVAGQQQVAVAAVAGAARGTSRGGRALASCRPTRPW